MHPFGLISAHTHFRVVSARCCCSSRTSPLPESCSLMLHFFLFDFNLGATPQPLASSLHTHLIRLKPLAASHELELIAVCFRLRLHIATFGASQ